MVLSPLTSELSWQNLLFYRALQCQETFRARVRDGIQGIPPRRRTPLNETRNGRKDSISVYLVGGDYNAGARAMLVQLIDLYSVIVLVAVVISWMQLPPLNPIERAVHAVTEPALEAIRRILPPMSGLDFSPIVLLLGLRLLQNLVD